MLFYFTVSQLSCSSIRYADNFLHAWTVFLDIEVIVIRHQYHPHALVESVANMWMAESIENCG